MWLKWRWWALPQPRVQLPIQRLHSADGRKQKHVRWGEAKQGAKAHTAAPHTGGHLVNASVMWGVVMVHFIGSPRPCSPHTFLFRAILQPRVDFFQKPTQLHEGPPPQEAKVTACSAGEVGGSARGATCFRLACDRTQGCGKPRDRVFKLPLRLAPVAIGASVSPA